MRNLKIMQKLMWRLLYGKWSSYHPTCGLLVDDRVTRRVADNGSVVLSAHDESDAGFFPAFRYIVAPNAVDTVIRTPEEVTNKLRYCPRNMYLLVHKPQSDIADFLTTVEHPVVRYNDIISSLTPRGYTPEHKRLYIRAEEDLIRAVLENGESPIVVRYCGTRVTRARYLRLAREYYGVEVTVLRAHDPVDPRLNRHERRVYESWEEPKLSEGFDRVICV